MLPLFLIPEPVWPFSRSLFSVVVCTPAALVSKFVCIKWWRVNVLQMQVAALNSLCHLEWNLTPWNCPSPILRLLSLWLCHFCIVTQTHHNRAWWRWQTLVRSAAALSPRLSRVSQALPRCLVRRFGGSLLIARQVNYLPLPTTCPSPPPLPTTVPIFPLCGVLNQNTPRKVAAWGPACKVRQEKVASGGIESE